MDLNMIKIWNRPLNLSNFIFNQPDFVWNFQREVYTVYLYISLSLPQKHTTIVDTFTFLLRGQTILQRLYVECCLIIGSRPWNSYLFSCVLFFFLTHTPHNISTYLSHFFFSPISCQKILYWSSLSHMGLFICRIWNLQKRINYLI